MRRSIAKDNILFKRLVVFIILQSLKRWFVLADEPTCPGVHPVDPLLFEGTAVSRLVLFPRRLAEVEVRLTSLEHGECVRTPYIFKLLVADMLLDDFADRVVISLKIIGDGKHMRRPDARMSLAERCCLNKILTASVLRGGVVGPIDDLLQRLDFGLVDLDDLVHARVVHLVVVFFLPDEIVSAKKWCTSTSKTRTSSSDVNLTPASMMLSSTGTNRRFEMTTKFARTACPSNDEF